MMSLKKATFYISFLFITFSTIGCMTYKDVEVIEVVDVGIKSFTAKRVDIEVAMQIKNPNNYNINIVDSDLEIFVKSKRLAIASIDKKIVLEKNSNKIYRFTINSYLKEMGANVFPIMMNVLSGKAIEIQVKGDFKAKVKGVGKRFPIDFTKKVKM